MDAARMLKQVRERKPLVVHVTNIVTANQCANVCLCTGGSPCMSMSPSDAAELARGADAVVVNIGTLDSGHVGDALLAAASAATDAGRPLLIDPVGAGASTLRTAVAKKIMSECIPKSPSTCVVKGNAGEIGFLSGLGGEVRGVDSSGSSDQKRSAEALAGELGCIVASTGPTDIVSDGTSTAVLERGTPMLGLVTGTGCMVSSVIGCFIGACGVSVDSVSAGINIFNIAAEKAASVSKGPGTFASGLFDAVYNLSEDDLRCSNYMR